MTTSTLRHVAHDFLRPARRIHVTTALFPSEILSAQKLRHQNFQQHLGAQQSSRIAGVDADIFDRFCEHLIVRDENDGRIVGNCRILSPENLRRVGQARADAHFDLTRLQLRRNNLGIFDRCCSAPDHRPPGVSALLLSGLTRLAKERDYSGLFGTLSFSMSNGGQLAANLYNQLRERHLAPTEYHVFPRYPLPLETLQNCQPVIAPPLLTALLSAGGWLCGEPAWDPDLNTADLPIYLPTSRLTHVNR